MKRVFINMLMYIATTEGSGGAPEEIKTSSDLLKQLNTMREGLEQKAKDNAKAEVTEQLKAVNQAIEDLKAVKPEVTADELKDIKAQLDVTVKALDILSIRVKGQNGPAPTEKPKSFNERIAEAVENGTDLINKYNRGEIKSFNLEVKAVAAVSVANVTGSTAHWGAAGSDVIRMNQNTMTHVRSLLPTRTFGPATDYYFMRENGAGEGTPAFTAEAALKPQIDVDLVEDSVKFEVLAAWMLISNKALKNVPGIVPFLQARLPERMYDAEDAGILYGNGTSPNIKGILASGNFVAGSAAGTTPLVEKIINDISLLEDTYKRTANGIVMRPADYYSFFKNKAAGSGEYDLPQGVVFVNGVLYILGVPVAKTTALTAGDYVVGDFNMGAELLVQEAMNLRFFEQDSTNVRTNQTTIRIEETIALPVYGSNYFVKGSSLAS